MMFTFSITRRNDQSSCESYFMLPATGALTSIFVIPIGFEPMTYSLEENCSIQLSYGTKKKLGK